MLLTETKPENASPVEVGGVTIRATGDKNPAALGCEVHCLGLLDPDNHLQTSIDTVEMSDGWDIARDIDGGEGFPTFAVALRGLTGEAHLDPVAKNPVLILLSHPWSGVAEITAGGHSFEVDLYSEKTRTLSCNPVTGHTELFDVTLVSHAAFSLATPAKAVQVSTKDPVAADTLRIRALGSAHPNSLGSEVNVLEIQPLGFGINTDLKVLAGHFNWGSLSEVDLADNTWPTVIKTSQGELTLRCDLNGSLTLLKHSWSGLAEITYGDTSVVVDLYSAKDEILEVAISRLDEIGTVSDETAESTSTPLPRYLAGAASGHKDARSVFYEKMTAELDINKPVGLYVPRWKGVALSTETVFDQSLPVPFGEKAHPDDITPDDIDFYANMLVATGCRHFVISGGDTFNLKIMEKVVAAAPDTRFDLLWHSNYLQMGEAHDWQLLRHWIRAANEGKITRIAAVKAGMEQWFRSIGLDAVFIPNLVPFDVNTVTATTVKDCAGIWLSGSTQYRKMPHAAISAVSMIPGLSLKASGLDESARKLVAKSRTPFRQIWSKPLPREQLHREMKGTGVTLYVTLSECSPMLPLESFSLGVPCLVGPASHLYRDHAELAERLIVTRPMSPSAIAEKVQDVLNNQAHLLALYKDYYLETERVLKEGVAALTR